MPLVVYRSLQRAQRLSPCALTCVYAVSVIPGLLTYFVGTRAGARTAVSPYVSVPATTAVANTAANLVATARQAQDALTALIAHPYLAYLTTSHQPLVPSVSVPVGVGDEPIDIEGFD